jgi:hypothetical protein
VRFKVVSPVLPNLEVKTLTPDENFDSLPVTQNAIKIITVIINFAILSTLSVDFLFNEVVYFPLISVFVCVIRIVSSG